MNFSLEAQATLNRLVGVVPGIPAHDTDAYRTLASAFVQRLEKAFKAGYERAQQDFGKKWPVADPAWDEVVRKAYADEEVAP